MKRLLIFLFLTACSTSNKVYPVSGSDLTVRTGDSIVVEWTETACIVPDPQVKPVTKRIQIQDNSKTTTGLLGTGLDILSLVLGFIIRTVYH